MQIPGGIEALTWLIESARTDPARREDLFALIHEDLRAIARSTPHVGRHGDTLQPTVLVNELFIQLDRRFPAPPRDRPESRATFFRSVALVMRTIVRDHWRARIADKRGGGLGAVPLKGDEADPATLDQTDFLALDDALGGLERYNRRWYEVVLMRYFAVRSIEETALLLGIADSTVSSDWRLARAWLRREMEGNGP